MFFPPRSKRKEETGVRLGRVDGESEEGEEGTREKGRGGEGGDNGWVWDW